MTRPPVGSVYRDPKYQTPIVRLTDATRTPNAADGGMLTQCRPEYATMSPWNLVGTLLLIQHDSYFGLYSGEGTFIRNLPFAVNASSEPRWSRKDADTLYFIAGNRLMACHPSTGAVAEVKQFPYGRISGKGEGDLSQDNDRLVLIGDDRFVFIFDATTGQQFSAFDAGARALDSLYIASDGGSFTVTWVGGGIDLFDLNGRLVRRLAVSGSHMDIGRDPRNGEMGLLRTNSNDNPALQNCSNGIEWIPLSDPGRRRCLLPLDWALAVHIGLSDAGVAVIETVEPTPSGNQFRYKDELVLVNLDGTVRSLCSHNSAFRGYESFPKAAISRDGTKILFGSNWGEGGENYMDAYLITLGPTPPPPTPTPTPLTGDALYVAMSQAAPSTGDGKLRTFLTADEWNVVYKQVTGETREMPDPDFYMTIRDAPIKLADWIKKLQRYWQKRKLPAWF
jgi:hypothetical protein